MARIVALTTPVPLLLALGVAATAHASRLSAFVLEDPSGALASPTGVAAGPGGRMWYSSNTLNVPGGHFPCGVASVDLAGRFRLYKTPAPTTSIAPLPDGTVYATEELGTGRLVRISQSARRADACRAD